MKRSITAVVVSLLLAVVGGFARLILDSPASAPVDVKTAVSLATDCFPPAEIPASMPVSLSRLRADDPDMGLLIPPPADRLEVDLTTAVPVDPIDPELRRRANAGEAVPLRPGSQVRVGNGEFALKAGSVALRRPGGRSFLLRAPDIVRFRQADNTTYIIELAESIDIPPGPAGQARSLPPGTRGTLRLPDGRMGGDVRDREMQPLSFVMLQPVLVRPWLEGVAPALMPVRASTPRGLSDILIDARQPGMNFAAPGLALGACAWAGDAAPGVAAVADAKPGQLGAATLVVMLSPDLLPAFSTGRIWREIRIALASADGQFVGYGSFGAVDRGWAGLIARGVVGLLLAGLFSMRFEGLKSAVGAVENPWQAWFGSLFIGPDRDPSLSLFQIFFWTVICVWGLAYVYVVTGSLLSLTPSMMVLLGIAGTGSVLARWIGVGTSQGHAAPAESPPVAGQPNVRFDFGQMLSTGGNFDLLKLQLFVFTLMIGTYVIWRVADAGVFPELDTNTLLLLGVSQGVYIGGKLTGTTALSRAQTVKLDLDLRKEEKARVDAKLEELRSSLNDLISRAAGAPPSSEQQKEKEGLETSIREKEAEQGALAARIAALTEDLARTVKELGLSA